MSFISDTVLGFSVPFLLFFPALGILPRFAICFCAAALLPSEGTYIQGALFYSLFLILSLVPVLVSRLAMKSVHLEFDSKHIETGLTAYFMVLLLSKPSLSFLTLSMSHLDALAAVLKLSFLCLVPFIGALLLYDLGSIFLARVQSAVLPYRLLRCGLGVGLFYYFVIPELAGIASGT